MNHPLIIFGFILIATGIIIVLIGKFGLPHLPGDIVIRRGNMTIYLPIVTSIILSIILSLLLRFFQK